MLKFPHLEHAAACWIFSQQISGHIPQVSRTQHVSLNSGVRSLQTCSSSSMPWFTLPLHSIILARNQQSSWNSESSSFSASNWALSVVSFSTSLKESIPFFLCPAISTWWGYHHLSGLSVLSTDALFPVWPSPHCPRVNSLKCKSDSVIPLLKTCFFPPLISGHMRQDLHIPLPYFYK